MSKWLINDMVSFLSMQPKEKGHPKGCPFLAKFILADRINPSSMGEITLW